MSMFWQPILRSRVFSDLFSILFTDTLGNGLKVAEINQINLYN